MTQLFFFCVLGLMGQTREFFYQAASPSHCLVFQRCTLCHFFVWVFRPTMNSKGLMCIPWVPTSPAQRVFLREIPLTVVLGGWHQLIMKRWVCRALVNLEYSLPSSEVRERSFLPQDEDCMGRPDALFFVCSYYTAGLEFIFIFLCIYSACINKNTFRADIKSWYWC